MKKLLCWYYYGHYLWYKLIREPEKDIVYNIALITSGLITAICMCIRQIMSLYFGVSWPFSYVFIFSVVIIDVVSYLKLPSVIKKHDKRIIKAYSKYPKWKKILISTIVRVSTLVIMYFGLAHVWLIFNPYGDHFESCNGPVPYTEPWLDVVLDRVLHAIGLK
ncbi:MAG: hypothetical protein PUE70_11525 [Sodaliphilus pleomorphus]|nr:hypothetical protein [Sodaliphilus pleomorphus]